MKIRKSLHLLLLMALTLGTLTACATGQKEPVSKVLSLESPALAFQIDTESHQYTVTDKRTGRVWQSEPQRSEAPVLGAKVVDDTTISIRFKDRFKGLHFTSKVSLVEDILSFEVMADDPGAEFMELKFPPILHSEMDDKRLLFCNRGSGIRLPVKTRNYPDKRLVVYANTGALDIPLFGIMENDTGEGLMLVFETPTEAAVNIAPGLNGVIKPDMVWFGSFDKFVYSRKVSFHFIDDGGYVEMARRYRDWAIDSDLAGKTLVQKAADREAVNWLKGATVVWGNIGGDIVLEGPVHGVERMMLNGRFTLDLMEQARDQGYLLGEYDNYSDITEGPLGPSQDNIEEAGLRGKDGELVLGWRTKEGKQYYNRSSRYAKRAAEAFVPGLLEKYPYTARFLDVHSTLQFFEDYNPDLPMDRRMDMKFRQDLYGYITSLGLVTGGEAVKAWCVPYVDYSEGNISGSFYWFSDVGHLVALEKRSDLPEAYLEFGMDQTLRIPLWELIFHDRVASTWYWGDGNGYFYNIAPEMSDVKDAVNILLGTMPLVWLDHLGYGWNRNRDRLLETVYTVSRLHERIAFDKMTDHRFLTGDSLVQETRFSSGAIITVNFDAIPRRITASDGSEVILAPNGYHVELDAFEQSRTWKDDAVETHIQADDFLYVSTTACEPRAIGPAVLTGELAAFAMPDGHWNIRYRSKEAVELDLEALGVLEKDQAFRIVRINDQGQFTSALTLTESSRIVLDPSGESILLSVLPGVDNVTPVILPQGGQITTDQPVKIVTGDPSLEIRYTLDGSEPDSGSKVYTEPLRLTTGTRIRAASFRDNEKVSPTASANIAVEVPLFESPVVRGSEKPVVVDIPIEGLSKLEIQITDGEDGPHFDQAAMGDAYFVTSDGKHVSLTEYAPESSVQFDFKRNLNNYEGDPIVIGGNEYEDGISSHAIDRIIYVLEEDFVRFKAEVGVHDRTTWKGPKGRKNGSVRYIFTGISKP